MVVDIKEVFDVKTKAFKAAELQESFNRNPAGTHWLGIMRIRCSSRGHSVFSQNLFTRSEISTCTISPSHLRRKNWQWAVQPSLQDQQLLESLRQICSSWPKVWRGLSDSKLHSQIYPEAVTAFPLHCGYQQLKRAGGRGKPSSHHI